MAEEHETRPPSAGRPPSSGRGRADDADEREEGEIADDDSGHAPPQANPAAPHPLEHAWTFWFDNPQGKSKQATWGSSIRPIHTFSTVEDFWRFPTPPPLLFPSTTSPSLAFMNQYCRFPI